MVPAIRRMEDQWFLEQLAKLNHEGLIPYGELVPIRGVADPVVSWAPWGATMWRFHRAWCIVRVTGGFPMVLWGRQGVRSRLDACPLCGLDSIGVTHALVACPMLLAYRAAVRMPRHQVGPVDWLRWSLEYTVDSQELQEKIRYVGSCLCAVICGTHT